ncbi:MAG: amino acid ABC transporter permease [Candidatus Babeliales bacterium]
MQSIAPYTSLLMTGAATTVAAWLLVALISISIGTIFGIVSCRYLAYKRLQTCIRIYTFIAKGIPAYVQILIAYFALPALLGINLSGFIAASGALAFCSSGYVTEIIRSGINAVPKGQWQACSVLGYPLLPTLKRIILPQTIRTIAPALFGEGEQILKSTALFAAIGVMDLTRAGMNIISRELNPVPVYILIACLYLLLSAVLQGALVYTEQRTSYGYR